MRHSWPGNIRELANAIQHATILCDEETILSECVREHPDWFQCIGMPYKRLTGRQLVKARLKDRIMAMHPLARP